MEGTGNRFNKNGPPPLKLPTVEHTSDTNSDETRKKRSRSEVWGSNPTCRSEHLSNQETSNKVLIMKVTVNAPDTKIPKAYSDAISSPEGKLWKDAMDYELDKLEEMNMWSEMNKADIPQGKQILPGMWVHLVKNMETGERKFRWCKEINRN